MKVSDSVAAIAGAALALLAQPASARADDSKLGKVHFETSCTPQAQKLFDQAMLYQHSFWYRASQKVFEDVLKADPECGIAYWGIALSLLLNPHVAPPAKNLAEGATAIAKGKSVGAKTERERGFIDALAVMYTDYDKVDHRTRVQAYSKAMEQLAQRFPNDDEVADLLRAVAQYFGIAGRQDLRESAQRRRDPRADICASAATSWRRTLSDSSLRLSADRGKRSQCGEDLRQDRAGRCARAAYAVAYLHARRVLAGVHRLQCRLAARCEGRIRLSRSAACHGLSGLRLSAARPGYEGKSRPRRHDDGERLHRDLPSRPYTLWRFRPARYAIERGDWKAAASLEVRPSPLSQVQAITYFARALGAARSGNPEAAKPDIAKLVELRDKLREAKDGYWSEQVDIQQKVASAWVLYAEGKYDDALNAMSAAADAEDRTEKHPVTPGVPTPARELYGVMLLDRGKPTEALVAFEATLKKEPNRLHAYVGAAKAAEKSGDAAKAKEYYGKVVAIAAKADTTRTDVADARAYVSR